MKKDLARSPVTALAVVAVLSLSAAPVRGQVQPEGGGVAMVSLEKYKAKKSGPTPRTADGKPDLSGLWGPDPNLLGDISHALKPGEQLPLQPWALKLTKERLSKDDPMANCQPSGVPRMAPYLWKIVQTPKLIVFLYEANMHSYRQIFMDGRGHRGVGHPHTEKLHVIERFRRPDSAHLEFEVTIDDPGAYTRPFTLFEHSPLMVNTEIMEYFCSENNQDVSHIIGKGRTIPE